MAWKRRSRRDEVGPFNALGHRFVVRTDDEVMRKVISRAFTHLRSDDVADHVYESRSEGVWFDGTNQCGCLGWDSQVRQILWDVNNRAASATSTDHLLLHASVVAQDGRALVMPAKSRSGKSTLATALLSRGLEYLSDEIAAIDPNHPHRVLPYARPVGLDEASMQALSTFPTGAWDVLSEQDHQLVPRSASGPADIAAVVFPAYSSSTQTELVPIRRSDAVVAAAENSFNFLADGPRWLGALATAFSDVETYRLPFSDLRLAAELARSALL